MISGINGGRLHWLFVGWMGLGMGSNDWCDVQSLLGVVGAEAGGGQR